MTIGIDASRANREHRTGTEWYSYYLIRWIAKLDLENQYILYTDEPLKGGLLDLTTTRFDPTLKPIETCFDNDGYQVIKSPGNNFRAKILNWPFNFFWTQGRFSLEMLFHRPDVLFIPSHTLPLIHPRRSVVTIHDIGYERRFTVYDTAPMGPEGRQKRRFLNFIVRIFTFGKYRANTMDYLKWSTDFALNKADRIITISEFTKRDIKEFYSTNIDKVTVVPNGYSESIYKPLNDSAKTKKVLAKYGIEAPFIFYIGRIERKKNIPALIEAFAIMKENNPGLKEKLVLVGDASYGYDETKYMIREFDLVSDVVMPGWVEEDDVPYLYCAASIFVLPSLYEGFGIPLLQAMACGVPIAASEVTSIPEVVGDAGLLFNPNYALSIAEALTRIVNDKKLQAELIEKGLERVKDFSWQKTAKKTLEVITYKD
ncbi:glycosyltransferase family 4 protein [Candidatus Parcubacteria bacterium]|nr:glycosyltransferase family 4 protein [Candidatus Parcubacteria bacterium]